MTPTEEDVRATLRGVVDPELGANIVDLGMVNGVDVADDGFVAVTVALTIAGCPLRVQIRDDVESKVRGLPGVTGVKVQFGEMNQEQRSAVMQRARQSRRRPRARAPRCRSPPASSPSPAARAAWARAASPSTWPRPWPPGASRVGVLDADIWGFSVPRMLGLSGRLERRRPGPDPSPRGRRWARAGSRS